MTNENADEDIIVLNTFEPKRLYLQKALAATAGTFYHIMAENAWHMHNVE